MSNEKVVHLQPARRPAKKEVWVEAVGAGNCLAAVERLEEGEDRGEYRFSLARMEPGYPRKFSLDFRAEDVLDLPKLAQVLAATLVDDGWLEQPLKDDLRCLADALDWFLDLRTPGAEWMVVRREALEAVLDHVWKSEIEGFRNLSTAERNEHVFRAVVELRGLLGGRRRPDDENAGWAEDGAGMHV